MGESYKDEVLQKEKCIWMHNLVNLNPKHMLGVTLWDEVHNEGEMMHNTAKMNSTVLWMINDISSNINTKQEEWRL